MILNIKQGEYTKQQIRMLQLALYNKGKAVADKSSLTECFTIEPLVDSIILWYNVKSGTTRVILQEVI